MDKLIEMMANAGYYAYKCGGYKDNAFHSIAKGMLSVIRQNVHLVAKVCPECGGSPEGVPHLTSGDGGWGGGVTIDKCKLCQGHGVVAREDSK